MGSVLMRTAVEHPTGTTVCSRGCGVVTAAGGVRVGIWPEDSVVPPGATRLPRRPDEESLPPRNGGDRDEHGDEEDEEEAGDWTSTSSGTHDENDDDGEWGVAGGDAMPKGAAFFFLPLLGGRVSAGGLDFLRGFLGLGSDAILL